MTTRSPATDPAELIGAYALDAVDASERRLVEQSLVTNAELRAELDEHYDTLGLLVAGFEESPPIHVWEVIQTRIAMTQEIPEASVVSLPSRRDHRRRDRFFATLGAAAAVAVLVLGVRVVQLGDQVSELEASTADPVASAAGAALASADATVAVLAGASGTGIEEVTIVIDASGVGYVFGDSLPGLDDAETYQLWAITGDAVVSAGVLGSEPGIAPFQVAGGVDGLAITIEQAGGVVASENPPAAIWAADA